MERKTLVVLATICAVGVFASPWAAIPAVVSIAGMVAMEGLRLRADLKIVKESAAALIKHEARLNSLERAMEAAVAERIA